MCACHTINLWKVPVDHGILTYKAHTRAQRPATKIATKFPANCLPFFIASDGRSTHRDALPLLNGDVRVHPMGLGLAKRQEGKVVGPNKHLVRRQGPPHLKQVVGFFIRVLARC